MSRPGGGSSLAAHANTDSEERRLAEARAGDDGDQAARPSLVHLVSERLPRQRWFGHCRWLEPEGARHDRAPYSERADGDVLADASLTLPAHCRPVPRYLVETHPYTGEVGRLVALAGARFPEVAIERRYTLGGDPGCDAWVCRAATDHHIRRFTTAAGLTVRAVSRIDSDVVIQKGTRP